MRKWSLKAPTLSNQVIPVVPGEYYAYSSEFSAREPVYTLMHCKANKHRLEIDLPDLGDEANLLFLFDSTKGVKVCSVGEASDLGILDSSIRSGLRNNTFISETNLSEKEFYEIRSKRNGSLLEDVWKANCHNNGTPFIPLKLGMVISVMTTGGKYGLFLMKEVCEDTIKIDACHILL